MFHIPTNSMELLNICIISILICILLIILIFIIGYMLSGSMHHPISTILRTNIKNEINGIVAPGYESVLEKFQKIIDDGMEDKAQVCAFVDNINNNTNINTNKSNENKDKDGDGDVHYINEYGNRYNSESIQNIFSSTKAISSIIIAMLVDRGNIKYNTKIIDIWPEFGQKGKDFITLEDVLKHESGLEKFDFSIDAHDLHRIALKQNNSMVSKQIASAPSRIIHYKSSSDNSDSSNSDSSSDNDSGGGNTNKKDDTNTDTNTTTNTTTKPTRDEHNGFDRKYNFVTRDIILNEIVRRSDPKHRTIGEMIKDEIAIPLGLTTQLMLGEETYQYKSYIFPLIANKTIWVIAQLFNIFTMKISRISAIIHLFILHSGLAYRIGAYIYGTQYSNPTIILSKTEIEKDSSGSISKYMSPTDLFNHPVIRQAEIPSANGHASAYALAKVASVMASGGTAHGIQLLRQDTYKQAINNTTTKYDKSIRATTKFNTGMGI